MSAILDDVIEALRGDDPSDVFDAFTEVKNHPDLMAENLDRVTDAAYYAISRAEEQDDEEILWAIVRIHATSVLVLIGDRHPAMVERLKFYLSEVFVDVTDDPFRHYAWRGARLSLSCEAMKRLSRFSRREHSVTQCEVSNSQPSWRWGL